MRIEHFDTEWGNPGSYSQAVRFGDLIFTCGQLGAEPGGPTVDFETQARTALERLVSVVSASGGGRHDREDQWVPREHGGLSRVRPHLSRGHRRRAQASSNDGADRRLRAAAACRG